MAKHFVLAAALLTVFANPLAAQSDPAVQAQEAKRKCEDAYRACANACRSNPATCGACETTRDQCRLEAFANVQPKPPGSSGSGSGPKSPPPQVGVNCSVPIAPGAPCKGDGVPCTFDFCRNGQCVSQTPSLAMTIESPDGFKIGPEPRMPVIKGQSKILGVEPDPTADVQIKWTFRVEYTAANKVRKINKTLGPLLGKADQTPAFGFIRGGKLIATATLMRQGQECGSTEQTAQITGTNPPFKDVKAALGNDPILARIACHESRGGKQFVDGKPQTHVEPDKRMGVGIMQVTTPTPTDDAFWDWKANIREGLKHFHEGVKGADDYYARMRKRKPPAPALTAEQLQQNRVTRYNGDYYWKYRNGKWVADPPLQPWPQCKGQKQSNQCRPYYDLVMTRAECK